MGSISNCEEFSSKLAHELAHRACDLIRSGALERMDLVWLELTGCSGNIISLLDGSNPGFQFLTSEMVNLVYENSLMAKEGSPAIEQLLRVRDRAYILAVEGAVATKNDGLYNIIGMYGGRPLTAYQAVQLLSEKASSVLAVGTCASDGGMSAAKPNPAECISVRQAVNRNVINLPGCPCHPDWFLGTLAHILLYGEPELDGRGRPVLFYGIKIHDRCSRRSFFDKGIFATKLGDPTCMFKVGCRGPVTYTDCPIRKWNRHVNWPVQDNAPCIGCAQFGFPDKMEPFISYDTTRTVAESEND